MMPHARRIGILVILTVSLLLWIYGGLVQSSYEVANPRATDEPLDVPRLAASAIEQRLFLTMEIVAPLTHRYVGVSALLLFVALIVFAWCGRRSAVGVLIVMSMIVALPLVPVATGAVLSVCGIGRITALLVCSGEDIAESVLQLGVVGMLWYTAVASGVTILWAGWLKRQGV